MVSKKIQLLKQGKLSESEFFEFLENFPYKDLGDIKLDFHRKIRRGLPEAIYGSGKSVPQLEKIIKHFTEIGEEILITRVTPDKFEKLSACCGDFPLIYHQKARIVTFDKKPGIKFKGAVLVVTAGSSDEEVAEEAYVSALYLGNQTDKAYDVGVACLPRILDLKSRFKDYSVIIVVAGMEGALPSVVAGLTSTPVIAVPTSVGYGANFNGLAALLSMLNTCSGGVSVVNIDNGFGAAYQASLINQKITHYPDD
ncbi:MAG: nickel pincer cofactor biosynthesis protein LarB [Candidatus Aminicenantes bacterium]|nr:MAG: nickel pincer cofactor biosynthesis protein LarB [Candidatus Aminicenantes bacterium]